MTFDPRTLSKPVYEVLVNLKQSAETNTRKQEQKKQAIELYTYLATWGMMRLKAEEKALSQTGKQQVVERYFKCLEDLSEIKNLAGEQGLETLKDLDTEEYLGLTGLGLSIAQEFSFWAMAVYHDVKGEA